MDTPTVAIRLVSQVSLVLWCVAAAGVLSLSHRHRVQLAGMLWAVMGLACFAMWMFLSALTIRAIQLVPRDSLLWLFAGLEAATTVGAWGWLVVYTRHNFHFTFHLRGKSDRAPFA